VDEVSVDAFRSRLSDYVAQAERGATFILLRHGRPTALLGPALPEFTGRPIAVSRFRASLRRSIGAAADEPVRITYRGRTVAVLQPISAAIEQRWQDLA
jgi:antitoxin (DNA-binding transcriptional repressor) of toxin-antitoxin stability system